MTRPSFSAAITTVYRAIAGAPGRCLAVALAPALLIGVATTVLDALAVAEAASGFGSAFVLLLALVAMVGSVAVVSLVVVPVSTLGLAWIGAREARRPLDGSVQPPLEDQPGLGPHGISPLDTRPANSSAAPVPDPALLAPETPVTRGDEVWSRMIDRGPRAVGAFVVSVLLVAAAPVVLGLVAVVLAAAVAPAAGAFVGLLAAGSLIWPAFVWWVRWWLAVPAVAVDPDLGVLAALERSRDAVRGAFWWVFGLLALSTIGGAVIAGVVGIPFAVLSAAPAPVGIVAAAAGQTVGIAISLVLTGVAAGVAYAMLTAPPEPVHGELDLAAGSG